MMKVGYQIHCPSHHQQGQLGYHQTIGQQGYQMG
jgi:hypothetical protein